MTGEKRFRTSLFGYKKKDVYDYIEKLARDLEERIRAKDNELNNLRNQNKYLISQNEELMSKLRVIEGDRSFIADAIIKAEEQAKFIIDQAVKEAERQREELIAKTAEEKERLSMVQDEIRQLRLNAIEIIRRYEEDLAAIVPEQEDVEALQGSQVAASQEE